MCANSNEQLFLTLCFGGLTYASKKWSNVLRKLRSCTRPALALGLIVVLMGCCSAVTSAQVRNVSNPNTAIAVSTNANPVTNTIVFQSKTITVRRISISPGSSGYRYRYPGGSIIFLTECPFFFSIPLGPEIEAEFQVGAVIPIPAGDYVLENPNSKPLEFLSIERVSGQ